MLVFGEFTDVGVVGVDVGELLLLGDVDFVVVIIMCCSG
jgi:hypothetical protein